jgi:hypothetical protein
VLVAYRGEREVERLQPWHGGVEELANPLDMDSQAK